MREFFNYRKIQTKQGDVYFMRNDYSMESGYWDDDYVDDNDVDDYDVDSNELWFGLDSWRTLVNTAYLECALLSLLKKNWEELAGGDRCLELDAWCWMTNTNHNFLLITALEHARPWLIHQNQQYSRLQKGTGTCSIQMSLPWDMFNKARSTTAESKHHAPRLLLQTHPASPNETRATTSS